MVNNKDKILEQAIVLLALLLWKLDNRQLLSAYERTDITALLSAYKEKK